jgi:sugar lactone lactonase YvrE
VELPCFPQLGNGKVIIRLIDTKSITVSYFSRLFWTDWNKDGPKIESSSLDGSDRTTLVDAMLGMPNSLTLDYERNLLCWADGGAKMTMFKAAIGPKIGEFTFPLLVKQCM